MTKAEVEQIEALRDEHFSLEIRMVEIENEIKELGGRLHV